MPDDYEITHGLNWQINDANDDLDGDGVSNLAEYQNGTDPQTAENFFQLGIQLSTNSTATILDFYTLPGKNYTVEQTLSLSPTNWVSSFILSGVTNSRPVRVTNAVPSSALFYRLRIQ